MTVNYGRLIKLADNQVIRQMDDYARHYDLTGTQMSILDFIANKQDSCLQRDLEIEFNIRRSTATVLLRRMQTRDLVIQARSATDARQKQVTLTAKGKRLQQATQAYINRVQSGFVAQFTASERADFSQMLQYWIKGGIQ